MLNQNNSTGEFPFSELIKLLKNCPEYFATLLKKAYIILFLDILFIFRVLFLAFGVFIVIAMFYVKISQYIYKRKPNKNEINI